MGGSERFEIVTKEKKITHKKTFVGFTGSVGKKCLAVIYDHEIYKKG